MSDLSTTLLWTSMDQFVLSDTTLSGFRLFGLEIDFPQSIHLGIKLLVSIPLTIPLSVRAICARTSPNRPGGPLIGNKSLPSLSSAPFNFFPPFSSSFPCHFLLVSFWLSPFLMPLSLHLPTIISL